MSTRIAKDPEHAKDNGLFAGTVAPGPTPAFTDPSTPLFVYFGFFIPVASPTAYLSTDDFPEFKLEMRDITLCSWSDVATDSSQL